MITFKALLPDAKNAIQLSGTGEARIMLDVLGDDADKVLELFRNFQGVSFVVTITDDPDAEDKEDYA